MTAFLYNHKFFTYDLKSARAFVMKTLADIKCKIIRHPDQAWH